MPQAGPNIGGTGSQGIVDRLTGTPEIGTGADPEPSQVWADIWRDALQAGLASIRREPDPGDER